LESEIIGSVLLYPKGTVIAISRSASITLIWPEVRLLAVAPAARGHGGGVAVQPVTQIVADAYLQESDTG
jgi:hypothetical protein